MKGYTTREVAEVLGLATSTILAWTRRGLISPQRGPGNSYVFSFQDIILLRAARELIDADVPSRRVRESLEALRAQLPVGRPLSAVTISAEGARVLVQDEGGTWEPNSGQIQMELRVEGGADAPLTLPTRALQPRGDELAVTADDWYDVALDLEAESAADAEEAYRKALQVDPSHSDAHLNLGRLLHESGSIAEAEEHYRAATEADPESARAWYNLGVALEDQARAEAAVAAYERALDVDPALAVAHFNLSRLFESSGQSVEALSHLADYKRLVRREAADGG